MPIHDGAGPLTNTLVLAIALAAGACAVGEQPACCAEPESQAPTAVEPVPVTQPAGPDPVRARAESVTIAVILPRTGPSYLKQYGDLLLEGIRLAATESRRAVDLVVLDDAGLADGDSALVAEARDRGAVAVIGPLLSAGVDRAAVGRAGDVPLLLSPTASDLPDGAANVYTLNAVDLRGPRALAEYAIRGALSTASVLYPSDPAFAAQAWAFSRAFQELGGRIGTMVPYDSGTTTFGSHIGRVLDSRPDVVYLPLSPQDVAVMAPQLSYYGFRRSTVVLMGNESWADEDVLRRVEPQFTDGVVVSIAQSAVDGDTGRDDFVRLYEATYRRSLDNPFPALGYDALRLVLQALDDGANTPARVAERLARTRAFSGATGVLSVEDGALTRAPFVYRILEGRITSAPAPEQLRAPLPETGAADSPVAPTHPAE